LNGVGLFTVVLEHTQPPIYMIRWLLLHRSFRDVNLLPRVPRLKKAYSY